MTNEQQGSSGRDGYSPLQLVEDGRREVRAADGVTGTALVIEAHRTADGFELLTDDGARIRTGRLVVATGVRDELPPRRG